MSEERIPIPSRHKSNRATEIVVWIITIGTLAFVVTILVATTLFVVHLVRDNRERVGPPNGLWVRTRSVDPSPTYPSGFESAPGRVGVPISSNGSVESTVDPPVRSAGGVIVQVRAVNISGQNQRVRSDEQDSVNELGVRCGSRPSVIYTLNPGAAQFFTVSFQCPSNATKLELKSEAGPPVTVVLDALASEP